MLAKTVYLPEADAKALEDLARDLDVSQSSLLREGARYLLNLRARRANIESLIDLIDGEEPPKIRFRMK